MENTKDYTVAEFVDTLLSMLKTDNSSEKVCEDARCTDGSEDNECNNRWGDCVEATYSSKEYYKLKKECIEKDHEIFLLKRKVEALEYLIYNCIPKDDRRKSYN